MDYLKVNLTTIQLALLAINTTTCGLVVSKLQEIKEKYRKLDIKPITKELLASLKEQIILIIIGIGLELFVDSKIVEKINYSDYIRFTLEVLLITVFINSIQVLWDTGKSVFVLTDIMDEIDNNR